MDKRENNYASIDSQNVNLAIRAQGRRLDFARFRIYLKEKYAVSKAFRFIGCIPQYQDIYSFLQDAGYIVIFKPTIEYKGDDGIKKPKGNVDAELVLHAMIQYQNYDQAVIVTGDGDFYCLVDYLNKQGKLNRLLIPNADKHSRLLKPFAPNKIDFMNTLREKLRYKDEKKPAMRAS